MSTTTSGSNPPDTGAPDGGTGAGGAGAGAGADTSSAVIETPSLAGSKAYWDAFAAQYTSIALTWSTSIASSLLAASHLPKATRVLDLGCGPGNVTALLHKSLPGDVPVVAYDLSSEMIRLARERLESDGAMASRDITLVVGDAQAVEGQEPASFDRIVSNLCLFMVPDADAAFRRMRELLKPGGTAAFSLWGRAEHSHMFTLFGRAVKAAGVERPPAKGPPSRSSFHLGAPGIEALRKRLTEAGFSRVVAWRHMAPFEVTDAADAAARLCRMKRAADFLATLDSEKREVIRASVEAEAAKLLNAGTPIGLDVLMVVATA